MTGRRTDFVQKINDIVENVAWLEAIYRNGTDDQRKEYRRVLAGGWQYYCCIIDDEVCFAPSRMIGYVRNTFALREREGAGHGTETSARIDRILKLPREDNKKIEAEFRTFCDARNIAPFEKKREFWVSPEAVSHLGDRASEQRILADKKIPETEKLMLVAARIGQGAFRAALERAWNGRCCVTRCEIREALRASHIKPWGVSDNKERLDQFNGLLLAAHIDALFDRGLISFDDNGNMLKSPRLSSNGLRDLGIDQTEKVSLQREHFRYLAYHRKHLFQAT